MCVCVCVSRNGYTADSLSKSYHDMYRDMNPDVARREKLLRYEGEPSETELMWSESFERAVCNQCATVVSE